MRRGDDRGLFAEIEGNLILSLLLVALLPLFNIAQGDGSVCPQAQMLPNIRAILASASSRTVTVPASINMVALAL